MRFISVGFSTSGFDSLRIVNIVPSSGRAAALAMMEGSIMASKKKAKKSKKLAKKVTKKNFVKGKKTAKKVSKKIAKKAPTKKKSPAKKRVTAKKKSVIAELTASVESLVKPLFPE
jgi:hypothetical protein